MLLSWTDNTHMDYNPLNMARCRDILCLTTIASLSLSVTYELKDYQKIQLCDQINLLDGGSVNIR